MEKLLELYYEHKLDLLKRDMRVNWATEREIELVDIEKVEEDELEKNLNKLSDLKPFIKWLVENDKINRKRKMIKQVWTWWALDLMNFDRIQDIEYYSIEETLLMLLSISSSPIDDLISYLK